MNRGFEDREGLRAWNRVQQWACVAPRNGRRNLVRIASGALFGRVPDHELDAFEAETRSVNVSTNGEVTVMDAPLYYRIRPAALGVVARRRATASGHVNVGGPRTEMAEAR